MVVVGSGRLCLPHSIGADGGIARGVCADVQAPAAHTIRGTAAGIPAGDALLSVAPFAADAEGCFQTTFIQHLQHGQGTHGAR